MAAGKPCKITLSPSASARLNTSASSTASAYLSDPGRSFPDRLGDATAPAVFVGQQFYRLRHGHALPGNVGFHFITAVFRLVSAHIYNSFPFLDSLCGIMDVLDGSTRLPQSVVLCQKQICWDSCLRTPVHKGHLSFLLFRLTFCGSVKDHSERRTAFAVRCIAECYGQRHKNSGFFVVLTWFENSCGFLPLFPNVVPAQESHPGVSSPLVRWMRHFTGGHIPFGRSFDFQGSGVATRTV